MRVKKWKLPLCTHWPINGLATISVFCCFIVVKNAHQLKQRHLQGINTYKRYILYIYFTYVYRESVEIKQIHISLRHCYCIRGGILIRRSCSFLCQAAQESAGSIRQFANEPQDFTTCQKCHLQTAVFSIYWYIFGCNQTNTTLFGFYLQQKKIV